jgi:hypothetical protein
MVVNECICIYLERLMRMHCCGCVWRMGARAKMHTYIHTYREDMGSQFWNLMHLCVFFRRDNMSFIVNISSIICWESRQHSISKFAELWINICTKPYIQGTSTPARYSPYQGNVLPNSPSGGHSVRYQGYQGYYYITHTTHTWGGNCQQLASDQLPMTLELTRRLTYKF